MVQEQMVLRAVNGARHFARLIASCEQSNMNIIVMTLLGTDIYTLQRKQADRRFSIGTAIRIGLQSVNALRTLHGHGYVHR